MDSCVSIDQLERLLDEQLDDREQEALADHLEYCPDCQQRLEWLMTPRGAAAFPPAPESPPPGTGAGFLRDLKRRGPPGRDDDTISALQARPDLEAGNEPVAAPPRLPTIRGFRIVREVGRGGMGVVYEAEQEALGRRVALKVLAAGSLPDAQRVRRFEREARAAARLHHTHIVPVFGVGCQDGHHYFVMQFIVGSGLDAVLDDLRRLRRAKSEARPAAVPAPGAGRADGPTAGEVARSLMTGRFAGDGPIPPGTTVTAAIVGEPAVAPPSLAPAADSTSVVLPGTSELSASDPDRRYYRSVARIGIQVAGALEHAHCQGILHRDVKPSNLLLDDLGNVWVADFGLAKFEEGEDLSRSHDVVGTLRYMAPERFRGASDRRCDLYALGATLYELLTLRPAFESHDRLLLIDQIVNEPPAPPRQLDRRIPRDLETIVLKALAKDPKDRFATADELGAELQRFLEGRPIRSRPVPFYEQFWRWCKRNRMLAAATITAAALIVFVAVSGPIVAWTYRYQLKALESAERQGRLDLGNSYLAEGTALQRTGQIGQRIKSLDRLRLAAEVLRADPEGQKRLPEIRNQAIAALGLTDLRVRWEYECGPDVFPAIRFDAALERYAVVERSGAVVVRRVEDNRELVRLPGPDRRDFWFAGPAFSPDGALLVAYYARTGGEGHLIRVWHLGRRELLTSQWGRGALVFHPDNRRVLYHAPEGGIAIWEREERRLVRRLPLDFTPSDYALDPGGRRLAVNNTDVEKPRVVILELETGRVLADWRSQVGNTRLAWSADGQLLAVGSYGYDGRVYVWNVHREALSSVLQGHTAQITGVQFAHSGFLLATTSWDGTTRLWDAASGEHLVTAPGDLSSGFSADDRWLAFQMGDSGKFGIWDVAAAPECRTLHPAMLGNRTERRDATGVDRSDFSPDGRLVATSDGDGVRLWEAETGRELAYLRTGSCGTVLFHPDGRSLISAGQWGLYRWPIQSDPERGADALRVGPPEVLSETAGGQWNRATWLPDHRTVALVDNPNARVLLVDSSHPHPAWSRATPLDSGGNHRMTSVAVSPDGRWLAVGGYKEAGVRVWDLRRRRLERLLRPTDVVGAPSFYIGFSADGHWLVSGGGDDNGACYHFWRAGTWDLGRRIDGYAGLHAPAFTVDGRLMALQIASDQVLLAEAATGRELVRLTTLLPVTPTPLVFGPDGTKLVASTRQKTALVWDLRRIRDQLAPMGLDWDAPPYPVTSAATEASGPLPPPRPVRVVGEVIEPQARRAAELTEMNRRLASDPDDAEALIHRGWLFTQQKKWPEAIADLERRLRPADADACWLLAEAYQETSNQTGALAAFSRLLERAPEDRDARFQRGLHALALAQPDLAADDFTRILAAEPDLDRARYRLTQALIRLSRHREALSDLDALLAKSPNDYVLYQLRSIAHEALGDRDQARADREKVAALLPKDAMDLNNRAWTLATGPVTERDPERAVTLARRAVELAPGRQDYLNTLGVALYRVGQYDEAVPVLKQSLAAGKGQIDAFDLFFLAMARYCLGRVGEAHADFDRAVRWRRDHPNLPAQWLAELNAFQAEAQALLDGPPLELPADVFASEPPSRP
jgi:serine/threonine protein kinase/WD40 repeat protein/tetratricopeptide (TPR) repeat protein